MWWAGRRRRDDGAFSVGIGISGAVLARWDLVVLRAQWQAFMRVDLHHHWGVETVSGRGADGVWCEPLARFDAAAADYVHITGDRAWAMKHLEYLRSCARPELTDYGHFQHILECVSTYEHTIAAFNALNVAGLRFLAGLTGVIRYERQAAELVKVLNMLYAGGAFSMLRTADGSRLVANTILYFGDVGLCNYARTCWRMCGRARGFA